jgi:hypothetical protein
MAIMAVVLVCAACGGGSSPELQVRGAGPDGCEYSGPAEISSGTVELLASPSGLGDILAVVYELESEPSGLDVEEADLGRIVATVENENDVNFARRTETLNPGYYAIGCVYGDFDGIVGVVTVSS